MQMSGRRTNSFWATLNRAISLSYPVINDTNELAGYLLCLTYPLIKLFLAYFPREVVVICNMGSFRSRVQSEPVADLNIYESLIQLSSNLIFFYCKSDRSELDQVKVPIIPNKELFRRTV